MSPQLLSIRQLVVVVALSAPFAAARAQEVVYGPDGAPTVVQRKLHTMTGKWEVSLGAALAMNTALVDHYGALLSVTHHPNEWLDYGGELMANYTALSGLALQIRDKLPARYDGNTQRPNTGDEIAHDAQLRGGAFGLVRLAPVYGKFNLASELKVHFQAFVVAGAGGAMVHSESVNLCGTAGRTTCADGQYLTTDGVKPAGQIGGGLRLYLGQQLSLHTQVRAVLFPTTVREGADLTNPSSGTDKTYLGLVTMFVAGIASTF